MKYTVYQIASHWVTFALIVVLAGSGLAYSYDFAGDGALTLHQICGQLLIVVLVLRIIARLQHPIIDRDPQIPIWQRRAAQVVHFSLYATMIAYVGTGYVAASALGESAMLSPISLAFARSDLGETLLYAHFSLKWVLLGLLSLHISAALKHHFWDRDETLIRMTSHPKKAP